MDQNSTPKGFDQAYPPPPSIHWAMLMVIVLAAEAAALFFVPRSARDVMVNVITAAWPIYLCVWIRKIDRRSSSLYWAIASLVTGFLFSWLLWIVVIYEIREELLEHYNRREPIGLRLNWFLTLLFSFFYFQYKLNQIGKAKALQQEASAIPAAAVPEPEGRLTA
jgi:hypothetical protein